VELGHVEDLRALEPVAKLKSIPQEKNKVLLEVVLHNAGKPGVIDAFVAFAKKRGGEAFVDRQRDVGGLTFIPIAIDSARAVEVAQFSFVRVARGMPSIRPFRPTLLRKVVDYPVTLPKIPAASVSERAVIFDGGIPQGIRPQLSQWVTVADAPGIGQPEPDYEAHGLAVTAAFLFGPLSAGLKAPQPSVTLIM